MRVMEACHERGIPAHSGARSYVQTRDISTGFRPGGKGRKVKKGGGQDKGNRHPVGPVSKITVVCTLVSRAASGTLFLEA
jgi:hypothetical protein